MSSPEETLKTLLFAGAKMVTNSFSDTTVPMNYFRNWFLQHFSESKRDVSCDLDNFAIYFLNTMRQKAEHYLRTNETEQSFLPSIHSAQPIMVDRDTGGNEKNFKVNTPRHSQSSAPSTPNFASTPEQRRNASSYFESSLEESFSENVRGTRKNASIAVSTPTQSLDRNQGYSFQSDSYTPNRRIQSSSRRSGNNSSLLQVATPRSADKSVRNNSSSTNFCLGDFIVLHQSNSRSSRKKASQTQNQHTAIASTGDSTSNSKPKKRVVPTTISHRTVASEVGDLKPFGCSSSFSNENNILKLTNAEIEDKNKCSIMAARKSLKLNANEISKELDINCVGDDEKNLRERIERKLRHVAASKVESEAMDAPISQELPPVELDKLKNRTHIKLLADIYVVLMDLNFVTNILSEMAFVLNLLNAQEPRAVGVHQIGSVKSVNELLLEESEEFSMGISMLNSATSCIYFALCVLRRQRHLFAHLDAKSLGVVMHNERIDGLDMELKSYLASIYDHKQSLLLGKCHTLDVSAPIDRSFKSVYYQENKDSRQYFVSSSEFGAFKSQRDLFYKVLKLWETHHLNPNWNFAQELAPKIREIFKQSENPINMAHFGKLFVSQLLISASNAASPEDIGVDVDAEKFSKLSQRLVAPSNFSVDYQFPRDQAFFRDFITEAKSLPFIEQLKMALYSQLINLNSSTFEQLNVLNDNKETDELESQDDKGESSEFIVRPEVLNSMIILAKFLGYVTAYPYSQCSSAITMSANIEKKQLTLRSLFQPHFSVSEHLLESIKSNKILITLPWVIQYLVMLDNVTLQLEDIVKATYILFALYTQIGFDSARTYLFSSTSVFIIRCCLGWLFDTKPVIAEKYLRYRALQRRAEDNSDEKYLEIRELASGIFRIPEKDCRHSSGNNVSSAIQESYNANTPIISVLESLLPVACPFLAEFRVAIMPSKYATTKYVSRTGRYRHITTRIAESQLTTTNSSHGACNVTSKTLNSQQSQQNKLIEAFLHSQNASMRRLIEFVTERIYKSVVKDGQHKYILPSKAAADRRVNEIRSIDIDEVLTKVTDIYENAHEDASRQWKTNLPKVVDERIATALRALLPEETTSVVRKTYSQLIRQNAMKRIQQWFQDNLQRSNFYCGDLNEIAQKITKANKKEQQASSLSELKIVQLEPSVSDLLDELQYWLHCTSIRTELLSTAEPDAIVAFVRRISEVFGNVLPIIFYRLIGAGLVQITQHLIIHKPEWLTAELVSSVCTVWLHPSFQFVLSTAERIKRKKSNVPVDNNGSDDDSNSNSSSLAVHRIPSIFDGLITVAFIEALGENGYHFEKLKDLLIYLIKKNVLTIDNVNVLFVPIFKENWPTAVLNEISKTLQCVADETAQFRRTKSAAATNNGDSSDDEAKSHLFMEVLADLSRDVDNLSFY